MEQNGRTSFGRIMFVIPVVLFACPGTRGSPDTELVYIRCSDTSQPSESAFHRAVVYVMSELVVGTKDMNNVYYTDHAIEGSTCYGHGTCHFQISEKDCKSCLKFVARMIFQGCPFKAGATCVLTDCSIRYEKYKFHN